MGLTINYRLSWPAKNMREAIEAVTRLHRRCQALPFESVETLRRFRGTDCDYQRYGREDDARWLLIVSQGRVGCIQDTGGRLTLCPPDTQPNVLLSPIPLSIVAFSTWPGQGCETAAFGLRLLPETVTSHTEHGATCRVPVPETDRGWRWRAFCKTVYADKPEYGGVRHFLRCHLTVIAALEAARSLGFAVEVKDEGGFWENRSVEALAQEIGKETAGLEAEFARDTKLKQVMNATGAKRAA